VLVLYCTNPGYGGLEGADAVQKDGPPGDFLIKLIKPDDLA
jgi:hypothetical protein